LIEQAHYPHHLWQMDLKEKCKVSGLPHQITVANLRDIYSSLTIGAAIFELRRPHATLSCADMQAACRACFRAWGLPDILRTDKGTCFLGNMAQTGFPSLFTLWLVGLGVTHETIAKGQITQNGAVERFNRTYHNLVLRDGPFASPEELSQLSTATVDFLNQTYPSHAGSCRGRPPLQAHPEAAQQRRPYPSQGEAGLFRLERVDAYLAQFRWQRRADSVGKVSVGSADYYLGREHKGRVFDVSFDPTDRAFVFRTPDGTVQLRRPAVRLSRDDLLKNKDTAPQSLLSPDKKTPLRAYGK
jgi:transposase InsO family protein